MLNFFILNFIKYCIRCDYLSRPMLFLYLLFELCSNGTWRSILVIKYLFYMSKFRAAHTVWVPNAFAFVVQSTKVPPNKKDRLGLLVRVVGLEPTRSCLLRILSPVRLPFRHTRATTLLYIKNVIKSTYKEKNLTSNVRFFVWWELQGSNLWPPAC